MSSELAETVIVSSAHVLQLTVARSTKSDSKRFITIVF